ncbi:hypothetical protein Tco_1513725 [Tanacetum coccineum]
MDLFNLTSAPNPTNVKTGTRPRVAHEVPLLTVTASRVIEMEDAAVASESSETPSTIKKSPLDFAKEDPPQTITERGGIEDQVQDEVAYEITKRGRTEDHGRNDDSHHCLHTRRNYRRFQKVRSSLV